MIQAASFYLNRALSFLHREEGQDAFEYALVVGGISVVVVLAIAVLGSQAPGVAHATCLAMQGVLDGLTCPAGTP